MSNFHRIIWIDRQIRQKRYPDRRQIAEEFEISTRQAARDIEYMKDSMGAPIEYSAFKRGYHYTDETYILPTQYITNQDKEILIELADQYAIYGQGRATRIAELFRRIADAKDSNSSGGINGRSPLSTSHSSTSLANVNLPIFPMNSVEQEEDNQLKQTKEPDEMPTNVLNPYRATILLTHPQEISKLAFPYDQLNDNRFSIEFDSSKRFLTVLLTQVAEFEIIWPDWLREKLVNKLGKLLSRHQKR